MLGVLLAGILLLVLSKIPNLLTRISNREIFLNPIFVFRQPLKHGLRAARPDAVAQSGVQHSSCSFAVAAGGPRQPEGWTPGSVF